LGATTHVITKQVVKTVASRNQTLIDMIEALPAERVAEVEDFVEFLSAKARRQAALGRLLEIAPALEAAGAPPVSEEDVLAEIAALRGTRRAAD